MSRMRSVVSKEQNHHNKAVKAAAGNKPCKHSTSVIADKSEINGD